MDMNNMQFSWQYSPDRKFVLRPKLARGERSTGGGLWFVTLIPLIGMLLESFAADKYSGAVLWLTVIFLMFFGCFADLKHADDLDDTARQSLAGAVWIPPLYLYRRDKLRSAGTTKSIVLVILIAAAIFSNGFVQGLAVNEDSLTQRLENTPVSVLGFKTSDDEKTVGHMLESWFDDGKYKSDCTHSGDIYAMVYSGKHEGKSAEVEVDVEHDGYVFKKITAEGVTLDSTELKDDELKETKEKIFLGDEAEEENAEEEKKDDSEEESEEE